MVSGTRQLASENGQCVITSTHFFYNLLSGLLTAPFHSLRHSINLLTDLT